MAIKTRRTTDYEYDKSCFNEDPINTDAIATYIFYSESFNWKTVVTGWYSTASSEAKKRYSRAVDTNYGTLFVTRAKKPVPALKCSGK